MTIDHKLVLELRIRSSNERKAVPQSGVPELDEVRIARSQSFRPESWNLLEPRFERVQEILLALWNGEVIHIEGWTVGPYLTATGGHEGFSVIRWKRPTVCGDICTVFCNAFEAALAAAQIEAWRV